MTRDEAALSAVLIATLKIILAATLFAAAFGVGGGPRFHADTALDSFDQRSLHTTAVR